MLFYSTFWIHRRYSCPAVPPCQLCAYSCSAAFIHHQTRAWHCYRLAKGISFRIPPLPSCPSRLLRESGSYSRRQWQQRITTATCRLLSAQMLQPSSNPAVPAVGKMDCDSVPGNARQEDTCQCHIPPWWQTCWAPCSWHLSSRSTCQVATADHLG